MADGSEDNPGSDTDSGILSGLTQGFENVINAITQILSYINPFSENFFGIKLIEMLKEALTSLFVPDQSNVEQLSNTVNEKFGFIQSIQICIDTIQGMINNIEDGSAVYTLSIYSEYYSGDVEVFDLAWYDKFKPYGDLVFTGFAYVFFAFRLYKSIPSILQGFSSVSSGVSGTRGGGD